MLKGVLTLGLFIHSLEIVLTDVKQDNQSHLQLEELQL